MNLPRLREKCRGHRTCCGRRSRSSPGTGDVCPAVSGGQMPSSDSPACDIVISSCAETGMAQFVVRHLEDDVAAKLKRRAKRHGRSMEDEVRHILRNAAKE